MAHTMEATTDLRHGIATENTRVGGSRRRWIAVGAATALAAATLTGALVTDRTPDAGSPSSAGPSSASASPFLGMTPDAAARWAAADGSLSVAPEAIVGMSADAIAAWIE